MNKSVLFTLVSVMALSACTTQNAYTGEEQTSNSTWGALAGAAVGAAIGSTESREAALAGAAAGGLIGAGIGDYMDDQEADLRRELMASGVQVKRSGNTLTLIMPGNITFKTDSASIQSDFYPTLNSVAKVFKKYDKTTVQVIGHTDNTGSLSYNKQLSYSRADSVAKYLLGQGLSSRRFMVQGMGEGSPIASNSTSSGRASNRRVEIKIIPNK